MFRVAIAGGGTAGLTMSTRMARLLGPGNVVLIEPKDIHYYQPLWTLVGGGLKTLEQSFRPMKQLLPKTLKWEQHCIKKFDAPNNQLTLDNGSKVNLNSFWNPFKTRVPEFWLGIMD